MDYWTLDVVKSTIQSAMNELNISHLPTSAQLKSYGIYYDTLRPFGGLKGISLLMDIPIAQNPGNTKKSQNKIRPSRAFEKEAKAREKGLHYADLQKVETLRMAGGISV